MYRYFLMQLVHQENLGKTGDPEKANVVCRHNI